MKKTAKHFAIVLALILSLGALGQTATKNYVKSTNLFMPVTDSNNVGTVIDAKKQTTISYVDGLGRTTQSLVYKQSPGLRTMYQFHEYDALGREVKQYLPLSYSSGLDYQASIATYQENFYKTEARVAHSLHPYAETTLDNSPLNRVLETGAPGADWQLGLGHTVQMGYMTNAANEILYWQKNSSGNWDAPTTFAAATLNVLKQTDENGNPTIIYKDLQGREVCKKVYAEQNQGVDVYATTYYGYDDFGNLALVVPPQALEDLGANTTHEITTANGFENRVYLYVYDERQRVIEKKIPHKGWEYIVYDNLDRPILTQDANMRTQNKWNFVKYDVLGRPIISGIYTDNVNTSRSSIQVNLNSVLANNTFDNHETRSATNFTTQWGYTNSAYPALGSATTVHTVSWYDDYDFNYNGTADVSISTLPNGFTEIATSRTKGLATRTATNILDSPDYLYTTTWYDERARPIQTVADNHLGGTETLNMNYSFAGQLLKSHHVHTATNQSTLTLQNFYSYDHAQRLTQEHMQVNNENKVLLYRNHYNELGQLIEKEVHSKVPTTQPPGWQPAFLQNIDYAYNIRGWLTHINNADLTSDVYTSDLANYGQTAEAEAINFLSLNFEIIEDTDHEGLPRIAMLISEESEIEVTGNNNPDDLTNHGGLVIGLATDVDPNYGSLQSVVGAIFSIYPSNLTVDPATTIGDIINELYVPIDNALQNIGYFDPEGVEVIQTSALNYVLGRSAHLMEDDPNVFFTTTIAYSFVEKNGYQLFLKVRDAETGGTSFYEYHIMDLDANNATEYNTYKNLGERTLQFNGTNSSFNATMGTVQALTTLTTFIQTDLTAAGITQTDVKDYLVGYAAKFAEEQTGSVFFNDDEDDLWGMEIKYNYTEQNNPLNATALFNGNIAEIHWNNKGDEVKRAYGYQYDAMNRLLGATYKGYNAAANTWTLEQNNFNTQNISYDLNGNILSLDRNGLTSGTAAQNPVFSLMDNLSYTYSGDQLLSVTDNSGVNRYTNDFKDGTNQGNDYIYDANGNLTSDQNKSISSITYNHLNLPTVVNFGGGESITYTYDANGVKLKKVVDNYSAVTKTYYTAAVQYKELHNQSVVVDFIFSSVGRIVEDNGSHRYEYFYKDHLGNTRLGFSDLDDDGSTDNTEILQVNDYYAFGLGHNGKTYGIASSTNHKYLYNGKELQDDGFNLQLYSMDLRQFDPQIGRWTSLDPITHHSMSGYNGFDNNPIIYADPSGGNSWLMGRDGSSLASSGKHWSNSMMSVEDNAGIMSQRTFDNFYGLNNDADRGRLSASLSHASVASKEKTNPTHKWNKWAGLVLAYLETPSERFEINSGAYVPIDENGNYTDGEVSTPEQFLRSAGSVAIKVLTDYVRTISSDATGLSISSLGYVSGSAGYRLNKTLVKNFRGHGAEVSIRTPRPFSNIRISSNTFKATTNALKTTGVVLGAAGLGVSGYQYANGQISGLEFSVDAAFGIIGFMGPIGAGVSITYFGGKAIYEYVSGNSLFEKPSN